MTRTLASLKAAAPAVRNIVQDHQASAYQQNTSSSSDNSTYLQIALINGEK